MRDISHINGDICSEENRLIGLEQREEKERSVANGIRSRLEKLENDNATLIETDTACAEMNTNWLGVIFSLLLTAAVFFILYSQDYFKVGVQKLVTAVTTSSDPGTTVLFLALLGVATVSLLVSLMMLYCGAENWLPAMATGVGCFVFVYLIGLHEVALLMAASLFGGFLVIFLLRLIVFRRGNAKYKNFFHLLSAGRANRAAAAQQQIDIADDELTKATAVLDSASAETETCKEHIAALRREAQGVLSYETACGKVEKYPAAAVEAYGDFIRSYQLLNEFSPAFFELRSRMENEDADTLYNFAAELCRREIDYAEFLRLLQLSKNKGCTRAISALGSVFSQISTAAGNGDYDAAYALLAPLIDAGSPDALNIKLQLDGNKNAEEARLEQAKRMEEAAMEADMREAALSAHQDALINEIASMRKQQEVTGYLLYSTMKFG